jgi:sRNA-binding protein
MSTTSIKLTVVELAARFPAFVVGKRRPPLKLGICQDVIAAAPDIDEQKLRAALSWYTAGKGYVSRLKKGTARIGLDGAQAGLVTALEAQHARDRLKGMRRSQKAKAAAPKSVPGGKKENTSNASPAANAAPRQVSRLSLDSLRLAARARRESARQPRLAEARR